MNLSKLSLFPVCLLSQVWNFIRSVELTLYAFIHGYKNVASIYLLKGEMILN